MRTFGSPEFLFIAYALRWTLALTVLAFVGGGLMGIVLALLRIARSRTLRAVGGDNDGDDVQVHLVIPRNFNDAQQVADQFKRKVPVILNLQTTDHELSKRLIDFASGLTYALDGGMQRIAEKVFLLTPRNVEVSAEEKARLIDKGFFNQS